MARKTRQIGVALGEVMRRQLEDLAVRAGTGIAEEIRSRVYRTLLQDSRSGRFDEQTQRLGELIKQAASDVSPSKIVSWHNNLAVYDALIEAIREILKELKPMGAADRDLPEPYEPLQIGRMVATLILRREAEASVTREHARLEVLEERHVEPRKIVHRKKPKT